MQETGCHTDRVFINCILILAIREVPDSNLGLEIAMLTGVFSDFLQSLQKMPE
jgi:hypothetical protein